MSWIGNSYAINERKSNDYCRVKTGKNGETHSKYGVKSRHKGAICQICARNKIEM